MRIHIKSMYMINPTKTRLIIAAPACSLKQLSTYITSVFK